LHFLHIVVLGLGDDIVHDVVVQWVRQRLGGVEMLHFRLDVDGTVALLNFDTDVVFVVGNHDVGALACFALDIIDLVIHSAFELFY